MIATMSSTVTMKITKNGQISLPAEVRRRWNTDRVIIIDTPDGLVVRPFDPDAVRRLRGKYKGRSNGLTSEENRAAARQEPTRANNYGAE
jgi:AbrB family looped-hinge helix DNA binding protein